MLQRDILNKSTVCASTWTQNATKTSWSKAVCHRSDTPID